MSEPSPLSLRALALAQQAVAAGIRGGVKPWGRFRGPDVDQYQRAVGLPLPPSVSSLGFPWCIAAQFFIHAQAETPGEPSHCPRTASTLHGAIAAPGYCRLPGPRAGAVGILRHPDHIHGHAVICEAVHADGTVTTVEGDTNAAGSSTGDAWGRHTWNPADGHRGEILGWWDFGTQPAAS